MLNSADTAVTALDSNQLPPAQLDIKDFIHSQLKENCRDRLFMLNVERDLVNFIKNQKNEYYKFQAMNPYYRMLTHRICDYFGLGHNLDNSKQSVIVFKIAEQTKLPTVTFQMIINASEQSKQDKLASLGSESGSDSSSSNSLTPNTSSNNLAALQEPKVEKKQILKRDTNDQENLNRNNRLGKKALDVIPKTFEEKSAEYNRIKNRIFNNLSDNSDTDKASNQNVHGKESEVKQYKILNRTGKSEDSSEPMSHGESTVSESGQKMLGQKKAPVKAKQTTNPGLKRTVQTKNFSTSCSQVVQSNYGQMMPTQFGANPTQFVYLNQNGNYSHHQFNGVMFANVPPHVVANGAYQILNGNHMMSRAPIPQASQNGQTASARLTPKTRAKVNSPVGKKTLVVTKPNDRIKNIKFQVYNLSADLTKDKLNELLAPYIYKMEIMDKKTNAVRNGEENKSCLLDEASIDILIEFDNFDKIEEAFKDLNLNGGPQSTSPFLIKPVC